MRALDGSLAFTHAERIVSIFPYVEAAMLDRTSDRERDAAARLLARLHCVLPSWPSARPRPASQASEAYSRKPPVDLPGFANADLDERVRRIMHDTPAALTHGDFYRGNIRCTNGSIRAVFDWEDARYWSLEYELAWPVWEFTQSAADATLDIGRAVRFLYAYAGANGPVPLGDRSVIVPLIRRGVRREVRDAVARGELGSRPTRTTSLAQEQPFTSSPMSGSDAMSSGWHRPFLVVVPNASLVRPGFSLPAVPAPDPGSPHDVPGASSPPRSR